jgi:hypothetical protein
MVLQVKVNECMHPDEGEMGHADKRASHPCPQATVRHHHFPLASCPSCPALGPARARDDALFAQDLTRGSLLWEEVEELGLDWTNGVLRRCMS